MRRDEWNGHWFPSCVRPGTRWTCRSSGRSAGCSDRDRHGSDSPESSASISLDQAAVRLSEEPLHGQCAASPPEPVHGSPSAARQDVIERDVSLLKVITASSGRGTNANGVKAI